LQASLAGFGSDLTADQVACGYSASGRPARASTISRRPESSRHWWRPPTNAESPFLKT